MIAWAGNDCASIPFGCCMVRFHQPSSDLFGEKSGSRKGALSLRDDASELTEPLLVPPGVNDGID